MYHKGQRAEHGELEEPSIVELPTARLLGGVPNALFGTLYYALIVVSQPLQSFEPVRNGRRAAALGAALMSLVLMRSLTRNRRECPLCWTSHAVNLTLVALLWSERD